MTIMLKTCISPLIHIYLSLIHIYVNISITRDGYIKRISNRSIKASEKTPFGKKENDYLVSMYKANTLDHLLRCV